MLQFLSFSPCRPFYGVRDFNCKVKVHSWQRNPSISATSLEGSNHGLETVKSVNFPVQHSKGAKDKIREALLKVELSPSSYDTAWVAMVPSPSSPQDPCFPECIDWILHSQHPDGSWGLPYSYPSLIKDALSSTLACTLALQRWNVGEAHVKMGLQFIGSNFSCTMNKELQSPIGFDIIFPGMVTYAIEMGLDLPIPQSDIDALCLMRDSELNRVSGDISEGRRAYHASVAEGLGRLQDWQEVMKYQKENGSLFNSPSTTAAAIIHTQDEKALNYLRSILQKFGSSVPAIHPLEIYSLLCIVDNLERLGISQHFSYELKSVLDRIYRYWLKNDEEIASDITTRAMAFRILRLNGYDISSDALAQYDEVNHFYNSVDGHLRDINTVLELYKASQIQLLPNEQVLEKVNSWSRRYLEEELSTIVIQQLNRISEEVNYALEFPFYANLDGLEHKRNIELYNVESFRHLKTSYINCSIDKKDLLNMAVEDFNFRQSVYHKELEHLESWVKENELDQLVFARQKLTYCYLSIAATLFSPGMSSARVCWAKSSVLATVVDDFFDVGGSREELVNLIMLVETWDEDREREFCSEQVRIVFSALHSTITELGAKASVLQRRMVTNHIFETWLNLMKSMMMETEWLKNKSVPTMDEYIANGCVSFALQPIILPALYFVGPELSMDTVKDPEYNNLSKLVSMCGRLLNDIQGFEREGKEGKLNSISLRILHSSDSITEDEAKREMESIISSSRRELLRLVVRREGSVVPRACKDLFWKMCRVLHVFYRKNDGFTSPREMVAAVNALIHEPLKITA